MSFVHFLTIGRLDEVALARAEARALQPLGEDFRTVALASADPESVQESGNAVRFALDGSEATIAGDVARLPWINGRLNRAAVRLALFALDHGYLVADVEHARLVPRGELEGQTRIQMTPVSVKVLETEPAENDVVAIVDHVISTACEVAPCVLVARLLPGATPPPVVWSVSSEHAATAELLKQPARFFRTALARIGHHYLDGQLYGGYGRRVLRKGATDYAAAIYLSNEALSGFWVQIHLAPLGSRSPLGSCSQ